MLPLELPTGTHCHLHVRSLRAPQQRTGSADAMQAAVGRAAVQDVTGWASPEVPSAAALPFHTVPVTAAVYRLAGRLVDTHDGRDAPRATPHVVKGAGDRRRVP